MATESGVVGGHPDGSGSDSGADDNEVTIERYVLRSASSGTGKASRDQGILCSWVKRFRVINSSFGYLYRAYKSSGKVILLTSI